MKNINHRIVHFDLKGAPWKVPYLKEVIIFAKQWGATGILFEWEDSFPYTSHLISIGSLGGSSRDGLYSIDEIKQLLQFTADNGLEPVIIFAKQWGATGILFEWEDSFPYTSHLISIGSLGGSSRDGLYSIDEIKQLLQFTADNGLEPIQLVQSLGHLEFVLKHEEFAHLRELRYYPSVLCPSRRDGRELIVAMVKQALALQPAANFIHIGADEAWHLNKCAECNSKTSVCGQDSLFITHITAIVTEIKMSYPNVNVLIWDDMMREIKEESLLAVDMSKFVTPVVWHYGPMGGFDLNMQMWLKYEKCFREVWIASAFKGATSSCQLLPSVERYVSNQEAWIQQLKQLETGTLQINTVILTGWSRYDHYATLCELLPVSLQSLAGCLKMWTAPDQGSDQAPIELAASSAAYNRAGAQCARAIINVQETRARAFNFINGALVQTWMNPWQLAHKYTTPMQLAPIANAAKILIQELNVIRADVSIHLHSLTGPRSTEEWVLSNIEPMITSLHKIAQEASERSLLPPSTVPTVTEVNMES